MTMTTYTLYRTAAGYSCVPNDPTIQCIRFTLANLCFLSAEEFAAVWAAIFCARPELHPDDCGDGWPDDLAAISRSAWYRYEDGTLTDAQMYPAQQALARINAGMEGGAR
jgi:hypothetical protein